MPLPALPARLIFTASDMLVGAIAVTAAGVPVTVYHDPSLSQVSSAPAIKSQDGSNASKSYWLPAGTYSVVVTVNGVAQPAVAAVLAAGGSQTITVALPVGFYGQPPVAKPTITGSKAANTALASLITALASQGLVTDGTT